VKTVRFVRSGDVQRTKAVTKNGFAATIDEPIDTVFVGHVAVTVPPATC
jgi:hypothetical protein